MTRTQTRKKKIKAFFRDYSGRHQVGARWKRNERRAVDREPRYLRPDPNRIWPDENEFGPLMSVAHWAAANVVVSGYSYKQRVMEALMRLACSYIRIRSHSHPDNLARKVAKQHLQDLRRCEAKRLGREMPVSHIDDGPMGDDETWAEYSNSSRLDSLQGRRDVDAWWRSRAALVTIDGLHMAIRRLDERMRMIVHHFYGFDATVGELSLAEIAQILPGPKLSVDRVAHLKIEAIEQLRRLLSDPSLLRT